MQLEIEVIEIDVDIFLLTVECFDRRVIERFKEQGHEGNGYTWHALLESIARLEFEDEAVDLIYSSEEDSATITYSDLRILKSIASKMKIAFRDCAYMKKVMENADLVNLE